MGSECIVPGMGVQVCGIQVWDCKCEGPGRWVHVPGVGSWYGLRCLVYLLLSPGGWEPYACVAARVQSPLICSYLDHVTSPKVLLVPWGI